MYVWRRKKKVLAQLDALVRSKKDSSPVQPVAQQPTAQPVVKQPSSTQAPTSSQQSIFQRLKNVHNHEVSATTETSLTSVYGERQQTSVAPPPEEEQLLKVWNAFAVALPESEKHLQTIMLQRPKLQGYTVVVDITGESQRGIVNRADLLQYLRTNLNCPNLTLSANLTSSTEQVAVVYTSKQKLSVMIQQNAELQSLISRFNLTID